ncbi:hypothetical protein LTR17_008870 [Elasticomyces elasticus]|nr:hypothetical protein LTR17_008870 [Elasticomyces elasticus]
MATFRGTLNVNPFTVSIPDKALDELKQLLHLSKIGPPTFENTRQAGPSYGLSRTWTAMAKDHWLNQYDWRKNEARINSFDNYKANVAVDKSDDVELHFIALLSKKQDAVPIVLLHGWPGSPLEFLGLLEHTRKKYSPEEAPYTFIVPSLPGYGFSSGPSLEHEWTCETMASAVEALMVGLGYGAGYVAQGGDLGSFVARILAAQHSAKACHINFAIMPPPEGVAPETIDAMERRGLERAGEFGTQGDAYARMHGEKFLDWVDEPLDLDDILNHVSLYWFTETFPRAIYPYRQFFGPSPEAIPLKHHVHKPLGYSWFPKEIAPIPKAWVSTTANLVWYKQHTAGGHFAALERPQDLLQDIEEFVTAVWKDCLAEA